MRYFKKIKFFTIFVVLLLTLVGCFDKKYIVSKPANLSVSDNVLTWDEVKSVDKYIIKVNGKQYEITDNKFDLAKVELPAGSYDVKVIAVKGVKQSEEIKISYTVTVLSESEKKEIKTAFIKLIDPSLTLDEKESDFLYKEDFQQYQLLLEVATNYADTISKLGVSKVKAILLLQDLYYMNNINDITELNSFLSSLTTKYGLTSYRLAYLLVEFSVPYIQLMSNMQENVLKEYQSYYSALQGSIDIIKQSAEYNKMMEGFQHYASTEEYAIIEKAINNSTYYNIYNIRILFQDIIKLVQYNLELETNEFVKAASNAFTKAYEAGDNEFLQYFFDYNLTNMFDNLSNKYSTINAYTNIIKSSEQNIVMLSNLIESLSDNKTDLVEGVEVVINYSINLSNSIEENFLEYLTNPNPFMTPQEIMILKNEIVTVLNETMPSITEYEKTLNLFELIINLFSEEEITLGTSYAEYIYYSQKVSLALIEKIDLELVNKVMSVNMATEQEAAREIVALILYLDGFYNEFKTEQKTNLDKLASINFNNSTDIYQVIFDNYLALMLEQNVISKELVELIIQNFEKNQVLYEQVSVVFQKLGKNAYDLFVETEGKIFIDIYELQYKIINEIPIDPSTLANLNQAILNQIVRYYDETLGELTKEDLIVLVKWTYINSKLINFNNLIELQEFDEALERLAPKMADITLTMIELSGDVIDQLAKNNAGAEVAKYPQYNLYFNRKIQFILTFDEVLTSEVEAKLINNVNIIFNDILKDSAIFPYLGVDNAELELEKAEFIQELKDIFEDVHKIAKYDFNNLTLDQLEEIDRLFTTLYE